MSNSLIVHNRSLGHVDGSTWYVSIVGNAIAGEGTVANVEIPVREAGVLSNLYCYAPTNTASVSSTVTFQLSQVDTAITITYSSDQTGAKEDQSNTATAAATDEANWEIVVPAEAGTNTLTITVMKIEFAPTTSTNCVTIFAATGSAAFTNASTTRFWIPNGNITSNSTETNSKWRVRVALTSTNFYSYVSANARTTDTVFGTRVNGVNGNQSVTYTSGQTGAKEDASNTDALAVGQDYNYRVTSLAGTDSMTVKVLSSRLVNTAGIFPILSGASNSGNAVGPSTTTYFAVGGGLTTTSTTEANEQVLPRFTFTASELVVWSDANTNAADNCVVTLRDNGAGSAVTITYTPGQTGLKNDSANTAEITSGTDEITYEVANADAAGTITFRYFGINGLSAAGGIFQHVAHRQQGVYGMAGNIDRPRGANPF